MIFHVERAAQFPIHISANFLYYSPLPPSNAVNPAKDTLTCTDSPEGNDHKNDEEESDASSES